jgi:hypothetical protein
VYSATTTANKTHEFLLLALVFNLDNGLAALVDDLERPVLHI